VLSGTGKFPSIWFSKRMLIAIETNVRYFFSHRL
jgi:hypothetical protein